MNRSEQRGVGTRSTGEAGSDVVDPVDCPPQSECVVYRMRDADGVLLYVGMSANLPQRLVAHRQRQEWWPRVARVDVKHFAGRKDAAREERIAIESEAPEFNVNAGHCVSWDTLAEKRAARELHQLEWRRAQQWDPEGSVVCSNCGHVPELMPKRQLVEKTRCPKCDVEAFERQAA